MNLVFQFFKGIKFFIVADFGDYCDSENLVIEVSGIAEEVSLKESYTFPIGSHTSVAHTIKVNYESIHSILYDSWSEFDIGCRIAYSSTEFFAVDDYSRELHVRSIKKSPIFAKEINL
ncbi:MAG: hypothetical protein WAW59_04105 [Patescibacteria group bacterium]